MPLMIAFLSSSALWDYCSYEVFTKPSEPGLKVLRDRGRRFLVVEAVAIVSSDLSVWSNPKLEDVAAVGIYIGRPYNTVPFRP